MDVVAVSEDIAFRIACALTPMLKSTASFARGIVIELLLKLYVVYGMLVSRWHPLRTFSLIILRCTEAEAH